MADGTGKAMGVEVKMETRNSDERRLRSQRSVAEGTGEVWVGRLHQECLLRPILSLEVRHGQCRPGWVDRLASELTPLSGTPRAAAELGLLLLLVDLSRHVGQTVVAGASVGLSC